MLSADAAASARSAGDAPKRSSPARLVPRLRVLRTIEPRPHRFKRVRMLTMALTVFTLYAIPLFDVARIDLWSGHHWLGRTPVDIVYGVSGVALSVLGFYTFTFALNAVLGRVFCGWGCPAGEASRHGDLVELARRTGRGRLGAEARAVGFALLLGGAALLWIASPRVFLQGTPKAFLGATLTLFGVAGAVYWHGRHVRWSFCTKWCPIGIYYSAVRTAQRFGVKFAAETCTDCGLCTQACPVGLHPRELSQLRSGAGGISLDDFPEENHCLTCGDCVQACESSFRLKGTHLAPLTLSRRPKPSRASD